MASEPHGLGLSDRPDRLKKSFEGERLRNGLERYIWYYAKRAQVFTLDERPAIHLDARVFSDPGKRDLGRHTGRHHEIIARMVAHEKFRSWMRNAHRTFAKVFINWDGGPILPAVVFCRSGKHRGVAASEILKGVLSRVEGWKFAPTIHMSIDIEREGCRCDNCRPDRQICESIEKSIALAVSALDLRDSRRSILGAVSILARAASGA